MEKGFLCFLRKITQEKLVELIWQSFKVITILMAKTNIKPFNGFITGENIIIDGGMSKLMIYHYNNGRRFD